MLCTRHPGQRGDGPFREAVSTPQMPPGWPGRGTLGRAAGNEVTSVEEQPPTGLSTTAATAFRTENSLLSLGVIGRVDQDPDSKMCACSRSSCKVARSTSPSPPHPRHCWVTCHTQDAGAAWTAVVPHCLRSNKESLCACSVQTPLVQFRFP